MYAELCWWSPAYAALQTVFMPFQLTPKPNSTPPSSYGLSQERNTLKNLLLRVARNLNPLATYRHKSSDTFNSISNMASICKPTRLLLPLQIPSTSTPNSRTELRKPSNPRCDPRQNRCRKEASEPHPRTGMFHFGPADTAGNRRPSSY